MNPWTGSNLVFGSFLLFLFDVLFPSCEGSSRRILDPWEQHPSMMYGRREGGDSQSSSNTLNYYESTDWNQSSLSSVGQVAGVTLNRAGNLVIFHRGPHVWDGSTFGTLNDYQKKDDGPIKVDPIIVLDSKSGAFLSSWGKNLFYLPHGMWVDHQDNYWVTDVAMHQVFKFSKNNLKAPSLTLGTAFKNGKGKDQFCKPTSAVVHSITGEIYVADGYCNGRIVKFSPEGKYLKDWGSQGYMTGQFEIPHKIILIESADLVCVSDRENGRIQCLNLKTESFGIPIEKPEFHHLLFSISYSPCLNGFLFAVNGPTDTEAGASGFVLSLDSANLLTTFGPGNDRLFSKPHDVTSSPDCKSVYVVEIGPNKVWKFETNFFDTTSSSSSSSSSSGGDKKGQLSPSASASPLSPSIGNAVQPESLHVTQDGTFIGSAFFISILSLVVIVGAIVMRRCNTFQYRTWHLFPRGMSSNRDTFDLSRLLDDPQRSGFNRVSTNDQDVDGEPGSDSEVEEFNVSSVRNGRIKV